MQRPWDEVRKFPARNTGTVEIPPYSIVMLADTQGRFATDPDGNASFCMEQPEESGRVRFMVARVDDRAERSQNPALFAVNGPKTIRIGGTGTVSQDWPLQVYHNGAQNLLFNGQRCGVLEGSFSIWGGLGGFTCLSHDPTNPIGSSAHHTAWISPAAGAEPLVRYATGANQFSSHNVQPGDPFLFGDGGTGTTNESRFMQIGQVANNIITLYRDGVYIVNVFATVWSSTAPRGASLQFAFQSRTGEGEWATRALGLRYQDIEENQSGDNIFTSRENVCISLVREMERNEQFRFINSGEYFTSYDFLNVNMARLGISLRTSDPDDPNGLN